MPWEDLFGPPAQLDPQELPTLKDVLKFAKYCQQESHGLKCLKLSSPQIGEIDMLQYSFSIFTMLIHINYS